MGLEAMISMPFCICHTPLHSEWQPFGFWVEVPVAICTAIHEPALAGHKQMSAHVSHEKGLAATIGVPLLHQSHPTKLRMAKWGQMHLLQ